MVHEFKSIGLTPHSTFKGTQEEHDVECLKIVREYEIAIEILESSSFVVRDWMNGVCEQFEDYNLANKEFIKIIDVNKDSDCDIQLYLVIDNYNTVD